MQTAQIITAMKQARLAKHWSARQFAEEMTKAGVHWNTDVVVNLEHGRRKSIRVHEAITAAYVLDLPSPLDLIVPLPAVSKAPFYPVTPVMQADAEAVRGWFRGQTGPLRWALEQVRQAMVEEGAFDEVGLAATVQEAIERGKLPAPDARQFREIVERLYTTRALAQVMSLRGGDDSSDGQG